MKVYSLFSGSSGNSIYLEKDRTRILVDAGDSMRRIEAALRKVDASLSEIDAILITHEHIDHTKGLPVLAKHLDVPIFCQEKVAKEMYLEQLRKGKNKEAASLARRIRTVKTGSVYEWKDVSFSPFATPHDSVDSQGFVFEEGEVGIATDLGTVSDEVLNRLLSCRRVILESNHDLEKLYNGSYPFSLKERVASDHGHLNNEQAAAFAVRLLQAGCQSLQLFHLSKEHNTPTLAYETTAKALLAAGARLGEDIRLCVAERCEVTELK